MAHLQVSYMSKALLRTINLDVILPVDKLSLDDKPMAELKPLKTLYLLHGIFGSQEDWITGTRVKRWAEAHDLAVVMPAGENAFYVDRGISGYQYGEWIGKELVEITRRMFPLSHHREDTFIAGLSMGGFGAVRNGLKYADTFGCIGSFSAALHLFEQEQPDNPVTDVTTPSFGSYAEAALTDKNPRLLIETLKQRKAKEPDFTLPRIYQACGVDDGLITANRTYRRLFEEAGFDVTYFEGPGNHDWDFWDQEIKKFIDWLPLGEAREGLSSGHVQA